MLRLKPQKRVAPFFSCNFSGELLYQVVLIVFLFETFTKRKYLCTEKFYFYFGYFFHILNCNELDVHMRVDVIVDIMS